MRQRQAIWVVPGRKTEKRSQKEMLLRQRHGYLDGAGQEDGEAEPKGDAFAAEGAGTEDMV